MKSEYVRKYREMDRDCALLSRYQTQEGEERQGLFIPDDERMSRLWGRWEQLNEGVEKLEEPDAVFSLVKHHFQDFLESFAYTLRDTQEHPEYTYLSLHWEIENVSRLNRHPDQEQTFPRGALPYRGRVCPGEPDGRGVPGGSEKVFSNIF